MNRVAASRRNIDGPSGALEVQIDQPEQANAVAVIAHPHPLYGGTLDNKVVQTLAKAYTDVGAIAVRFNFRGVGASAGTYAEGIGEVEDFLTVLAWARTTFAPDRVAYAGFSFGAFVAGTAAAREEPAQMTLIAPPAGKFPLRPANADTLVLHGEVDDVVPLTAVLDWARPQELPVIVIPGADHFFHRRLHILRRLVVRAWMP
jgi:alpha/beta superfamily hydrolase